MDKFSVIINNYVIIIATDVDVFPRIVRQLVNVMNGEQQTGNCHRNLCGTILKAEGQVHTGASCNADLDEAAVDTTCSWLAAFETIVQVAARCVGAGRCHDEVVRETVELANAFKPHVCCTSIGSLST